MVANPRPCRQPIEHAYCLINRSFESGDRRGVKRNVKMNPPFVRRLVLFECNRQILIAKKRALLSPGDDLMKVGVFGKRPQTRQAGFVRCDPQGGAQMDLADANILSAECCETLVSLLELDRKMAGIVVHAQVQTEARIVR